MKRLLTLCFLLSSLGAWAQATPANVVVNGIPLVFSPTVTTTPENLDGTVMVPANFVFQRLGFTVTYNTTTRLITASKPKPGGSGTYSLSFKTGSAAAVVNGVDTTLAVVPYLKNDRAMVPARLVGRVANCKVEFDHETQSVQYYYYDELDAGLYFIDAQDDRFKDVAGARKLAPGLPTRFYDPSKPTVIYLHGNQPGAVAAKTREDLIHKVVVDGQTQENGQNAWKAKGWNVAIFHWEQLADDKTDVLPDILGPIPFYAEYKMYNTQPNGSLPGTRWRRSDNSFSPTNHPKTVTDIFLDEYAKLIPASTSTPMPQIELVGNSLGGQLVMTAVAKMKFVKGYQPATGPNYMPSRITLMDPYWSMSGGLNMSGSIFDPNNAQRGSFVDYFGTTDLRFAVGKMMTMDNGTGRTLRDIPTTYYRTSILGFEGTSEHLAKKVAFIELKPNYVTKVAYKSTGFGQLLEDAIRRHTWPVATYFTSMNCVLPHNGGVEIAYDAANAPNTPAEASRTGSFRNNTCGTPSNVNQVGGALLSNQTILELMKLYPDSSAYGQVSTRRWAQAEFTKDFEFMNILRYTVAVPTPAADRPAATQPATATAQPLEMTLSPNPTAGPLQLDYTLPAAGTVEVQISDLLGRVRQTLRSAGAETAGAHTLRADLSTLPAGPYILTYSLNGKKLRTSKIMKGE